MQKLREYTQKCHDLIYVKAMNYMQCGKRINKKKMVRAIRVN